MTKTIEQLKEYVVDYIKTCDNKNELIRLLLVLAENYYDIERKIEKMGEESK